MSKLESYQEAIFKDAGFADLAASAAIMNAAMRSAASETSSCARIGTPKTATSFEKKPSRGG